MIARPGPPRTDGPLPNGGEVLSRAAAHLRALARVPRPAGSEQADAARRYCADVLTALGFRVTELPFEYSAAVGELGTSAAGVAVLTLIAGAAVSSVSGSPAVGLGVLVVGAALLLLAGRWAARQGVLELPLRRRRAVNLEARRTEVPPRLWLVAHIDSKSQPISLVVRALGIVLLSVAWLTALVIALESTLGISSPGRERWSYVVGIAIIGGIPVIASLVGNHSSGAIDNASGVATVLSAAELSARAPVGVLITDAEELGLAGARSWCATQAGTRVPVFNCDGVDDLGTLTLMWTRPRAPALEEAFRDAASSIGEPLRVIPLIPGVLVDGLAFSDAGWEAVTLSRGSIRTLRRIHTRGDDLTGLRGEGVAIAARVLARAALDTLEKR